MEERKLSVQHLFFASVYCSRNKTYTFIYTTPSCGCIPPLPIHNTKKLPHKFVFAVDMGVLGVIVKRLDAIIGPGVMLLFPLYASLRAIESPSPVDDQQWLTYWIIYSFITLFELSCWKILVWLPFWPYMKLVFCMWLVLPVFNGAAYIYGNLVRKYIKIGGRVNGNYSEGQKKVLQMMSLDARKSVMQYIDRNGWPAVERAIKAAEKEIKK